MKAILFDSSALISIASTCSCPLLEKLKKDYKGKFLIPNQIKKEIVDVPSQILRFKHESYRIKQLIDKGIIEVVEDSVLDADELGRVANSIFSANHKDIEIVHLGELSLLTLAKSMQCDAIVLDERTTRLLVEEPEKLPALLGSKLHTNIYTNHGRLKELREDLRGINILRSADLCTVAYLKGYIEGDKDALFGLLWALKFAGCSIAPEEIADYSKKFIK